MANDFKPTVGGPISKDEAKQLKDKYDKEYRKDKEKDAKSVFIGKNILQQILDTPGCTGISFFFAVKNNPNVGKDQLDLVYVGTQEDGKLINGEGTGLMSTTDTTSNSGLMCPNICPTP